MISRAAAAKRVISSPLYALAFPGERPSRHENEIVLEKKIEILSDNIMNVLEDEFNVVDSNQYRVLD